MPATAATLSSEQEDAELVSTSGIPAVTGGFESTVHEFMAGSSEILRTSSVETLGRPQDESADTDGQVANEQNEDSGDADDPDYTSQNAEEDMLDEEEIDYNSFNEIEPFDSAFDSDAPFKEDHPLSLFTS